MTMTNKQYFWLNVHNLGYAHEPPARVNIVPSFNNEDTILKDKSDKTYYDKQNFIWIDELTLLKNYRIGDKINLYVFNPDVINIPVDCYCFTNEDNSKEYYIPEYLPVWSSKETVMENNWKFVDGPSTLYMGESEISSVADSDMSD